MSPTSEQLANDGTSSSSNSTNPPSEATLADDSINQLDPEDRRIFESDRTLRDAPCQMNSDEEWAPHNGQRGVNSSCDSLAEVSSDYDISKYDSPECALLAYARTNMLDRLDSLLKCKHGNELVVNLNYKGHQKQNYSWSALHLACYFGHEDVVRLLLSEKDIDINIQNSSGDTPLHKATLTNRARIVQLLLSNGAKVFIKNCDGLLAKQLTSDKHIFEMLEATEQADKNSLKQKMFKAVDNGDIRQLQDYFKCYDSFRDTPELCMMASEEVGDQNCEDSRGQSSNGHTDIPITSQNRVIPIQCADFVSQMTDERGNTLLHLATMRGFKAICVFLLEQGFDPYQKNNLGQTCIELSSYQLRQLFMSVKPAAGRLKKLSKERITRFEGPLLRKVRILGWKQIYVVLENGVILLFNNRRDSMNRSRRGYKYLESATCEPSPNDSGMFTVHFSDNSRATFLVSPNNLSYYTSFKLSLNESQTKRRASSANQIELIRQKWLDSIRDHIVYSTEFIRKGLKLDDDDDIEGMNYDGASLSTLNHLLPMDTIKSFVQEARAHYSILERHAESLCNLAHSITSTNQQALTSSFETSVQQCDADRQSATTTASGTSTGSRILGFIRSGRQQRSGLASEEASNSVGRQRVQQPISALNYQRARSSNAAGDFIRDDWPCLLFHLRLLMESAENTKTTMGQAVALMEHQEQLRQNRIQGQEDRCRVLENSLQALARDHHELEKSISTSQIYQSACRSVSMSTDLNEYHDAFEDFDDEKTMTPDSLPSDEELEKQIRDVMDEQERGGRINSSRLPGYAPSSHEYTNENDEEDLESNCSALTVETVTDPYVSAADGSQALEQAVPRLSGDSSGKPNSRTRLPAPMIPRDQVSIWSILKNCIGKELSKITMPVVFNEPLTMLQRSCESLQYSRYLVMADMSDDPVERMEFVCAFIIASLSGNSLRIVKPFNPMLYETYEIEHELDDGSLVRGIAQQVSHHPPITAAYAESDYFSYDGVINPKIKFWGRSVEVSHDGPCRIYLKRHKEAYTFKAVACSIHNIIVGKLWFEHHGPLDVKCLETNLQANLVFKQAGWFSNDLHRFDGFISSGVGIKNPKKLRFVYGKWSDYIKSVASSDYENYMKDNQQKMFRIPDSPDQGEANCITDDMKNMSLSNSVNNNSSPDKEKRMPDPSKDGSISAGDKKGGCSKSESTQSLDIPNSRTLWRLDTQFFSEYYHFSFFTMKLNELTPELERTLPRSDSRFRPDVRKLEEGDLEGAASEKHRLEEKQREARSRDKRFKDPSPDLLWFSLENVPNVKDKLYVYKGGYWENKCNPERFPDLF